MLSTMPEEVLEEVPEVKSDPVVVLNYVKERKKMREEVSKLSLDEKYFFFFSTNVKYYPILILFYCSLIARGKNGMKRGLNSRKLRKSKERKNAGELC